MSLLVHLVAYGSIAVFLAAVAYRFASYLKNPIHVRWELYPVPHEGKRAAHGGSYLEDVDWWEKPRHVSRIGELKVMIPEILLLKAVWENNRSLWFITFPFHIGLYLIAAFVGVLGLGALAQLAGMTVSPDGGLIGAALYAIPGVLGPIGLVLCILGAAGLFLRRMTDENLRIYSSVGHFFNLGFFIIVIGIALVTWLTADPDFILARTFLAGLITFNIAPLESGLFTFQVLLACALLAYIPLTHMSHFFMKYFLYHDIRWGDEPNVNAPGTAAKIGTVLNYPVTWSAPHINIPGKKTWAEVATFNPRAEEGKEQ